jgi:hypothetical protein
MFRDTALGPDQDLRSASTRSDSTPDAKRFARLFS